MNSINFETGYIFQSFLVIFITFVGIFMQKKVSARLHKRFQKTKNPWDDAVVEAVSKPLGIVIAITGISFACEIIQKSTGAVIFEAVGPIRDITVIAAISWFLIKFTVSGERVFLEKETKADKTTVDAVAKLIRISILITSVLVTLQTLGFSVSGVLAFGGMGGVVVGLAAKDLLANFFGGLMIYMDRPFAVGDWIRSPDREIEGTVEHIGWRLTRIRTFDKRPLYLPNATFASIAVENPERMENRRIYETLGIRYQDADKMKTISDSVRCMLKEHPEIDTSKTLIVNFNSFAPSSIDFFVYTFTKTTDWIKFHEIKQDILIRIAQIVKSKGAEIAFPTSTIHLADGNKL